LITEAEQAEQILQQGEADAIALARASCMTHVGHGMLQQNWALTFRLHLSIYVVSLME
jgi:hypothetical protein